MRRYQLSRARKDLRWSQRKLAETLNPPVDPRTIQRWESGKARPLEHYREQLCTLFQKTEEELQLFPSQFNSFEEYSREALCLPTEELENLHKLAYQFLLACERLAHIQNRH